MYEIRASVPLWAQQTFEESLMGLSVSKKLKTKAAKCYQTLNLLDKPVNGYASENLPKTEEGKTGVKITYSEIFHELLTQGVFSPTATKRLKLFMPGRFVEK